MREREIDRIVDFITRNINPFTFSCVNVQPSLNNTCDSLTFAYLSANTADVVNEEFRPVFVLEAGYMFDCSPEEGYQVPTASE